MGVIYLGIFSMYWLYSLGHAVRDIHAAADIRHFTTHKLGLSESQLKTVTWPEVAKRIVNVSHSCIILGMPVSMLHVLDFVGHPAHLIECIHKLKQLVGKAGKAQQAERLH